MGNWFENMEPMNIQEERVKTKKTEESSLRKAYISDINRKE